MEHLGRSTERNLPPGGNWAALEEGAVEASISQVLCCTQLTLASLNREAIYKGYQVAWESYRELENQVSRLRRQHLQSHSKMLPGRSAGLGTDPPRLPADTADGDAGR